MSVTFLLDGPSEREFHGNLVYKLGRTNYFLNHFRKNRNGLQKYNLQKYNLQSECDAIVCMLRF